MWDNSKEYILVLPHTENYTFRIKCKSNGYNHLDTWWTIYWRNEWWRKPRIIWNYDTWGEQLKETFQTWTSIRVSDKILENITQETTQEHMNIITENPIDSRKYWYGVQGVVDGKEIWSARGERSDDVDYGVYPRTHLNNGNVWNGIRGRKRRWLIIRWCTWVETKHENVRELTKQLRMETLHTTGMISKCNVWRHVEDERLSNVIG